MENPTLSNTKSEIINSVIKLSDYLTNNGLGYINKSVNAWKTYKKEDLLDVYEKMINVIKADIHQRGVKGKVPELKEWNERRKQKLEEALNEHKGVISGIDSDIRLILNDWLGADLTYDISNFCIQVNISVKENPKDSLWVNFHYRPNYNISEGKTKLSHGGKFEINQPTIGTWNPKTDKLNIRFFEVISNICHDDQFNNLDAVCSLMDTRFIESFKYNNLETSINENYKNIAMNTIASEMANEIISKLSL